MVEPPGFRAPSGRPDWGQASPGLRVTNAGKHGEFANQLRRSGELGPALTEGGRGDAAVKFSAAQPEREIPASREGSCGLAPDEQPGLAPGPGEAAGLLFSISPTGGDGAVAPALGQTARAEAGAALLSERWVRRLSWGGDSRRAAARLELGAGRFAGAQLVIVAEAGHVSVELDLATTEVDGALAGRLRERLEARGYAADVTVR